jgi:hypothetical protein
VTATLKLTRKGFGIELRCGTFSISIDGKNAGSIELDQTAELPIEPGHHVLRISVGRHSSHERPFDVTDGEVASFRCHGTVLWPRYLASIVKPDLAISLTSE